MRRRHGINAIRRLVEKHGDIQVIYPVHINPVVREIAKEVLGDNELST